MDLDGQYEHDMNKTFLDGTLSPSLRVRVFEPGEYHPPPSPPTPGKEESVPPRRGSDGKLRGRKRVSDPAPPLDSDIEVNTRLTLRRETSILNRRICLGGVNITYLLFHCSGCLSGIWMKPSSFSTRSSREPSPHASERYAPRR